MQCLLRQTPISRQQPEDHQHHQPTLHRHPGACARQCGKETKRHCSWRPSATAAASRPLQASPQKEQPPKDKELHKIFDEVLITVRSGNGGRGEVVPRGKGRKVDNFKYKPGGSLPKKMFLPAAPPAQGADGASIVLRVDPDVDDLVHLHARKDYAAKNGSNGDPAIGSSGPQRFKGPRKNATTNLVIPVPPGTLVKKKRSGQLLGELLVPGETLVVARGGFGGLGATAPPSQAPKNKLAQEAQRKSKQLAAGIETIDVEDTNWTADTRGAPGEEVSLHLLLRMVADIGIVGLPNAGKSSLLACLTRASPEVAAYPFTTLRPNLGTLMVGGQSTQQLRPVLADLPGLIAGAHQGRGLGRMFLRHLRRTTGMLHVLDGSAADPLDDYRVVRDELRLYNPEYCTRPHVVALNKCDMFESPSDSSRLVAQLQDLASHLQEASDGKASLPFAVVVVSAADGTGLEDLHASTQQMLAQQTAARRKEAARQAANHGLDW